VLIGTPGRVNDMVSRERVFKSSTLIAC